MAFYRPTRFQGPQAALERDRAHSGYGGKPPPATIRHGTCRAGPKTASTREQAMVILLRQSTDRVVVNRPSPRESEGRVLPFRPRGALFARPVPRPPAAPDTVPDLEKFERTPDEPDDFRHRMLMNGLGLAVTVALVGAGIWIADVMAHMRKDQDCVLTGRPGCTHVEVPAQPR